MRHGLRDVPALTNRLIAVWWDEETRTYVKQAKRVSRNCPMTQDEVTMYARDVLEAVAMISRRLNCTFGEALKILRLAKQGRW